MNSSYKNDIVEIKVLTPTHIGKGAEFDLMENLDFVNQGNNVFLINKTVLLKALDSSQIEKFSELLKNGINLEEFFITNKHVYKDFQKEIFLKILKTQANSKPNLIKSQYSNGMGNYYLPGSSIKGAIRSVLFEKFKSLDNNLDLDSIFGKIDANLMNLLTIGDIKIPDEFICIYPTKVFSADGRPIKDEAIGKWKNKRQGGHVVEFDSKKFISYFEAILPSFKTELRIGLKNIANKNWLGKIPNHELLFKKPICDLVDIIKKHTNIYLEKEFDFYKMYENPVLKKQALNQIKVLKEENNEINSCVLRVGANVGYHTITGDWKFEDHLDGWGYNHQSGAEQIQAKTRKFTFEGLGPNFIFQPMGFIKLTIKKKAIYHTPKDTVQEVKAPQKVVKAKSLKNIFKSK